MSQRSRRSPRFLRSCRHRQPALRQVRHAAAVAAAGPRRRRRAQPAARAARRAALRDRHALRAGGRNARRCRGAGPERRAGEHWSGGARDVDFFDVKGVARASVRRARRRRRASSRSREPFLVAGQAAAIVVADGPERGARLGFVGQLTPALADARGLPRQDRGLRRRGRSRSARSARASRRAMPHVRFRAIHSSSAICRSSSPIPCLRKSFVAPF